MVPSAEEERERTCRTTNEVVSSGVSVVDIIIGDNRWSGRIGLRMSNLELTSAFDSSHLIVQIRGTIACENSNVVVVPLCTQMAGKYKLPLQVKWDSYDDDSPNDLEVVMDTDGSGSDIMSDDD